MKIRYGALLEEKKGIIPFSISTEEEEEDARGRRLRRRPFYAKKQQFQ